LNENNLKQLLISNTSTEGISIKIPKSIGKFINLEAILFQNIISSVPDEIGNLKNLNFLSLPNNPKLKRLPESLGNCENLSLVNLQGTPAPLPQSLVSRFGEAEGGFYWGS
jgi:Leucine-rich repeat (LRR) protein